MKVNKFVNVSPNLNPPKKELQLMVPFQPVLKRKNARKKFLIMKKDLRNYAAETRKER